MSLRKKETSRAPATKAFESGHQIEDEPEIVGEIYNDTSRFLENGEDVLKWRDIYHMFKKKKVAIDVED